MIYSRLIFCRNSMVITNHWQTISSIFKSLRCHQSIEITGGRELNGISRHYTTNSVESSPSKSKQVRLLYNYFSLILFLNNNFALNFCSEFIEVNIKNTKGNL